MRTAEVTRAIVQIELSDEAARRALEEDFTTKKLSLRVDLPNSEFSSPLLYISTGGTVAIYRWLADELSKRGVPADPVNRFLAALHQIDAIAPRACDLAHGRTPGIQAL
jgi:hypothetical protein